MLADGIIAAALRVNLKLPLVVRLAGTNSAEAKVKMAEFSKANSHIKIIVADDLDDAAKKAVLASEGKI
jgi:succinyl-CoA synthetase beta subunit